MVLNDSNGSYALNNEKAAYHSMLAGSCTFEADSTSTYTSRQGFDIGICPICAIKDGGTAKDGK